MEDSPRSTLEGIPICIRNHTDAFLSIDSNHHPFSADEVCPN